MHSVNSQCGKVYATCLEPHPTLPAYIYTNNLGQDKIIPYPIAPDADPVKATTNMRSTNGICFLDLYINGVLCDSTDISSPILAKIPANATDLQWIPATCTFVWTGPDGQVDNFPVFQDILAKLPVTDLTFDSNNCVLKWTDANGVCHTWNIGADIISKINVDVNFDPATCVLSFLGPQSQFKNWNIGQAVQAKIPRPSLTKNTQPDGIQQLVWDNGYGQIGVCNLTPLMLDTDNAVLTSDGVLTLTYGGDGNSGTVVLDVCQIVGDNCNSYFTQINPDGSWTYVDNNGDEQTYTPPPVVTLINKDGNALGDGAVVLQPDDFTIAGTEAPTTAKLLGFSPAGDCIAYDVPVIPDGITKDQIVAEFISIVQVPADAEVLFVDNQGNCRRGVIPTTPPEVFIGTAQPAKSEGYVVWFDPETCIVRFCNDAGDWLENRRVVCQDSAPPTTKGGADIWFNTAEGCLYVLCDGVWISSDTQAVRSVIDAMCMRIGDGPLQDLPVVDGKVVIPIPEPVEVPRYCLQIGSAPEIFGQETSDGKLRFNLPAYPEFFETCIRLDDGSLVVPHLENGKFFLDLDIPSIPELPTVKSGSSNVDVDLTTGPNGEPCYAISVDVQDIPDPVTKDDIVDEFTIVGGSIPLAAVNFLYVDDEGRCRRGRFPDFPDPTTVKADTANVEVAETVGPNGEPCFGISVTDPVIPELPTVKADSANVEVAETVGPNGEPCYGITVIPPDDVVIPELPTVKADTANVAVAETVGANGEPCYGISVTPQDLPELPTVKAGTSNVEVVETTGPNGEPCYAISVGTQDIPPLPLFCVEDKSGARIDASIEEGKIVINLPPVLACQPNQPAINGSAGCLWHDGTCLHVLCNGVWISSNVDVSQG